MNVLVSIACPPRTYGTNAWIKLQIRYTQFFKFHAGVMCYFCACSDQYHTFRGTIPRGDKLVNERYCSLEGEKLTVYFYYAGIMLAHSGQSTAWRRVKLAGERTILIGILHEQLELLEAKSRRRLRWKLAYSNKTRNRAGGIRKEPSRNLRYHRYTRNMLQKNTLKIRCDTFKRHSTFSANWALKRSSTF